MVWPFTRKAKPKASPKANAPGAGALPNRGNQPTADDLAILDTCKAWLDDHREGLAMERKDTEAHLHVGAPPEQELAPNAPCGAVLKAKKGKLHWIDLYDPTLRTELDQLVKHLDKQQKWYFNGVIATKYDEKAAKLRGQ